MRSGSAGLFRLRGCGARAGWMGRVSCESALCCLTSVRVKQFIYGRTSNNLLGSVLAYSGGADARISPVLFCDRIFQLFAGSARIQSGAAGASACSRYCCHRPLLRHSDLDRLLSQRPVEHQRRVLHGRARDDGMDCRIELCERQPGLAGADGLGGLGLSIWHPGHALVLDWRYPGDALPGPDDDALLLRVEDTLCPRIFETALRRARAQRGRFLLRHRDDFDERRKYVRHGGGDEGGAGLGPHFQHSGFVRCGGALRGSGWVEVGHLQRGAAVHSYLGRRAAGADSRPGTGRRMGGPEGQGTQQTCREHFRTRTVIFTCGATPAAFPPTPWECTGRGSFSGLVS